VINESLNGIISSKIDDKPNLWIPLKIFLSEVEYFPRIKNIDHIFEIKSNPSYIDFISVLNEWGNTIRGGDNTKEQSFRNEIRKANNALKNSLRCKKIGGALTMISIPFFVFDALMGIPIFGASSCLLGTALQASASATEWKNKWTMLGLSQ